VLFSVTRTRAQIIIVSKEPQPILESIFAFPPHRETLGGTSYLIVENDGNILVDCPAWTDHTKLFINQQGGVDWLVLTHRQGITQYVDTIQKDLACQIAIQEQEAYLLPQVAVTSFRNELALTPSCQLLWTPGFSPGSACLYYQAYGGVLFTGRHLLPNPQGQPVPLRMAKTFHWTRQLASVQRLLEQFTPDTLTFICPGANTGFLRQQRVISSAYNALSQLDFTHLRQAKIGLY
jgi:glyoxylase-like metal-dependent hydrolase (beta-lactamase superfamily II)